MAGAHTEAILNKLRKSELVQIILNTEANLGSQIAKLTTEVKDLLRPSVSVGKMPNTRGEIRWRWLEFQCLLRTMSLSRKFVTCFRKLAWIYVIMTFKPVIV